MDQDPKSFRSLHRVHRQGQSAHGCKVVVVTTHASNWIMGMDAVHSNPYDGVTLSGALIRTERLTDIKPKQAAVAKGFRGEPTIFPMWQWW